MILPAETDFIKVTKDPYLCYKLNLKSKMGKSLPRKCNSCTKTFKTDFVKHAKACPSGFTEWTFLDRAGNVILKEELKRMPNRIYDATGGISVDTSGFPITDGARAWSKVKRIDVSACTWAEVEDSFIYHLDLILARPDADRKKRKLLLQVL